MSVSARTLPGKRALAKAARRGAFLAAAARVLHRDGLRDATMEAVAAEASVSKVVLYRYFGSKEEMTDAVLSDVAGELAAEMATPWTGYGSGMARMLRVARARPDAFALLVVGARGDPRFGSHHARVHDAIRRRVEDATGDTDASAVLKALSSKAVASLALDAVAGWIEQGTPSEDDAFLAWYAAGTAALDRAWRDEG